MAKTTFANDDTIADFVGKMNQVAIDAGNIQLLDVPASTIVQALNDLRDQAAKFDDSIEVANAIIGSLSSFKAKGYGTISYDENAGVLELDGADSSDFYILNAEHPFLFPQNARNVLTLSDSNLNGEYITDNTISYNKFEDAIYHSLEILDSNLNQLFVFKSPGP